MPIALALLLVAAVPARGQTKGVDLSRLVEELLPEVEHLSGLRASAPLTISAQSRDGLRAYLEASAHEEADAVAYDRVQRAYELLGLIPDTLDLQALMPELMTQQLAGYYDFRKDTLFNDRLLAIRAPVEGHATLVMLFVQLEDLLGRPVAFDDLPDFSRLPLEAMMPGRPAPEFASAPRLLKETGAFPYGRGLGFAHALRARDSTSVPFAALLPVSSEQIMDPEGHFLEDRDAPTDVALSDTAASGWHVEYENSLGQFELSILLMERHRLQSEHVADGWDLRTRMGRSASVEQIEVDGRAVVRIIEADDGVDLAALPRAVVTLSGG